MIWLLGALGWLRKAFSATLALVTRYPLQCALVASLAANVWLWRGWSAEQDGRAADAAAVVAAQKQAVARQELADQSNLGGQLAAIDTMEKNHATFEAARRAGVDAYVARHGLPARACSAPSGPSAAGLHPDPGQAAGPVAAADTVAVPRADLEAFSQIELQNSEWQSFGQSLIDQGLAVRASDAGR